MKGYDVVVMFSHCRSLLSPDHRDRTRYTRERLESSTRSGHISDLRDKIDIGSQRRNIEDLVRCEV